MTNFLYIIGAIALLWLVYRSIRHSPELYSKQNLAKSTYTLGLLAVGLIAVVWILVLLLRH